MRATLRHSYMLTTWFVHLHLYYIFLHATPIILELCLLLMYPYYAGNYAGILCISNSFSSKHKRKGSKQRTLLSIYMPQSTRVMRYCTRAVQDTNASVMSLIQYLFFVDDKLLILFIIIDLLISYFFWQELCHNAEKAEILINAHQLLYLILI